MFLLFILLFTILLDLSLTLESSVSKLDFGGLAIDNDVFPIDLGDNDLDLVNGLREQLVGDLNWNVSCGDCSLMNLFLINNSSGEVGDFKRGQVFEELVYLCLRLSVQSDSLVVYLFAKLLDLGGTSGHKDSDFAEELLSTD